MTPTTVPLTMSVPEAGRILGIGRNAAYAAAASGQLPVIRIGRKILVPRARLVAMLDAPSASKEPASA